MQQLREIEAPQKEANEHIAILAGVQGSQGQDIKAILGRLESMDQYIAGIDLHLASIDQRLDAILTLLSKQP